VPGEEVEERRRAFVDGTPVGERLGGIKGFGCGRFPISIWLGWRRLLRPLETNTDSEFTILLQQGRG
jgi:hypothetical protein